MNDIETLIAAAKQHGMQSEPDHEIGDLVDIARFMWSQLALVSKNLTMSHFKDLIEEWGAVEEDEECPNCKNGTLEVNEAGEVVCRGECGAVIRKGVDDRDPNSPVEFTESPAGYRAREKWAERYDELNGAPESEDDR